MSKVVMRRLGDEVSESDYLSGYIGLPGYEVVYEDNGYCISAQVSDYFIEKHGWQLLVDKIAWDFQKWACEHCEKWEKSHG